MERLVYLITFGLYISFCGARISEHGNQTESVHKGRLKSSSSEEDNESGAGDDTYRERRVLQSGDILTPPELLPLAKRLMSKVDTRKPGDGTGIVSSSSTPEILSDKLFHVFFRKGKSIAQLTKYDIAGLDALQALALDGEGVYKNLKLISVDGGRCYVDKFANDGAVDNNMCYPNGPGPRKSIYMLLTKPITLDKENTISNNRKKREAGVAKVPQSRIDLMKKLPKNRQLIVSSGRKKSNNEAESKNKETNKDRNTQDNKVKVNMVTPHPPTKDLVSRNANLKGCRWNFECIDPRHLDSCRLKTFCPSKTGQIATGKNLEEEKAMQRVRRMIGISSIDEEVEKIMEARALRLRPLASANNNKSPVENLSDYYNRLLSKQVSAVKKVRGKQYEPNKKTEADIEEDTDNRNKPH